MRKLLSLVLFFALAMSAIGATFEDSTMILVESFDPWFDNFPGGYVSGYVGSRQQLYLSRSTSSYLDWSGSPWFDPTTPWSAVYNYSSLTDQKTFGASLMIYGDINGNSGAMGYLSGSTTNSTIVSLDTVLYPLEDRAHISGQKYGTRTNELTLGLYTYDCRDLVEAGQSGGCAGTDKGTRMSSYLGLGGLWFSFDLNMGTGSMFNFNRGDILPWSQSYIENWDRSWPSQPFNGVPEPGTMVLFGSGFLALGFCRRRR